MNELDLIALLSSVVAGGAPIVLAAIGETITEKSGLINLSLDGTILLTAMAAFAVSYETGSICLGFAVAAAVGALIAAVVGAYGVYLGQSQVAVGFVLTLMCRDLAYFLGNPYSRLQGPQLSPFPIPILESLPGLGPILFQQSLIVYFSIILIASTWAFLYLTRPGLELRAVGENPQAAFARGINAKHLQIFYAIVGGALVGMAGATYSLCTKPGWGRPQGAEGMGWIALAIVIFGGWHPLKVAAGAYLFAILQVVAIPLQGWFPSIPAPVFQVAPFPLMIFTLLFMHLGQKESVENLAKRHPFLLKLLIMFRSSAPKALGQSYQQE